MRFMHLSDARLGSLPESEKPFGHARAAELKECVKRALSRATEEGCELLLISGGLFSHEPVTEELTELNRVFLSFPAITVVMIAGLSDPLLRNAPARSFSFAPNVHFAASDGLTRIPLPSISACVYAASFTGAAVPGLDEVLQTAQSHAEEDRVFPVRFLLLPELTEADSREETLAKTAERFSYTALGGVTRKELWKDQVIQAGAPEPLELSETGEHGVYLGDVSAASGTMLSLRFLPIASASYLPLLIRVTEKTGQTELETLLRKEISARGASNIYRLRLVGKRAPDMLFDFSSIESEFRIAELTDETVPQYDFEALFREHPQDMIGYYVSRLQRAKEEPRGISAKAMYYGIDALLHTQKKSG